MRSCEFHNKGCPNQIPIHRGSGSNPQECPHGKLKKPIINDTWPDRTGVHNPFTITLFISTHMIVENNRTTLLAYLWIFPSCFGCNKTRIGDTGEFSIITIPTGSLPFSLLIQITPLLPLCSPLPLLMVKSFFSVFNI